MKAAKRAFYSLGASLKFTWGSDRRRFWHLYCSSVEPILLYGCSVSTHIQAKRESNCPDLFSGCSLHPSLKPLKLPLSSPDGSIKLAPSWSLGSRNYYSYAPFSAVTVKWLGIFLFNPASLSICATLSAPVLHNWPPWRPSSNRPVLRSPSSNGAHILHLHSFGYLME